MDFRTTVPELSDVMESECSLMMPQPSRQSKDLGRQVSPKAPKRYTGMRPVIMVREA